MCAEIEHPESTGSLCVGHDRKEGQTAVSGPEKLRTCAYRGGTDVGAADTC